MNSAYKRTRETVEDEASTSAGTCSDNELLAASGDDAPPSPVAPQSQPHNGLLAYAPCHSLTTEIASVLYGAIFALCVQAWCLVSCNHPLVQASVVRKRTKAMKAIRPPPGLSLPGDTCNDARQQCSLIEEIGPPPGLECTSRPPGIFDYSLSSVQKKLKQTPAARRPKTKTSAAVDLLGKQAQPVVAKPVVSSKSSAGSVMKPSAEPEEPLVSRVFDQAAYRKELSDVLRDLANGSNVAACVKRIRAQNVPQERQSSEFADILTRASEESRGSVRRLSFAFAVGIANGGPNSAFAREACGKGLESFFADIDELAAEVPRLRNKLANELIPTLRMAFSEEQLSKLLPKDCQPMLRSAPVPSMS